ncbi:MAG: PHP domain-containing protein, partial [Leadbetterella sp.]|nr:PHP domain-containing protein [Leadbetterella sp.]
KAYVDSVFTLERLDTQVAGMTPVQIGQIRLYGKIIQKAILEILETGSLRELEELTAQTPPGIFDIMQVKGLGIKKVKALWRDLGIDSLESLKEACEKGTIAQLKGFGVKTQDAILESIAFLESLKGKVRLDEALALGGQIRGELQKIYPETYLSGEALRRENIVSELAFIVVKEGFGGIKLPGDIFYQDVRGSSPGTWRGHYLNFDIPVIIEKSSARDLVSKSIIKSAAEAHLVRQNENGETFLSFLGKGSFDSEEQAYGQFGLPYIIPEMRNGREEFERAVAPESIITREKIRGTVHNHSTYSDGKHTLTEMARACMDLGWEYFGIADHSQTAAYARGMWPETVRKQHTEIDGLNAGFNGEFRILKGVESDILPDGSLDYDTEVLKTFDYIVASVHSVLSMDMEKATSRLIRAIENPYTSILGHPTGRLLLRRAGYPIDHRKVIDACAANGVIMELNANPYRLDIDWTWISCCLEKGVMISINPDAHSTAGLLDMKYGVMIARKAGLPSEMTLNALPPDEVMKS